ncbi:MAG: HDIG domain-containing protein [Desulfamplus sp.]|nr:HDIG domain-containing protein [Desulfamplus sp.]
MPPYPKHLEISTKRTGKPYQKLHDWLDNYPDTKADRHSLDKLSENTKFVRSSWGEESVVEFLFHVVEDAAMKDIETLQKAGCPEEAVTHSVEVARKGLEISSRVNIPVDRMLLIRGAIYHDLGKSKTYGMQHGEIGAAMARELGLEEEIIQIILKHIRGGMTEPEAVELGLPVRDYTLRTPEEKIIIYADRMVDIYTDGIVPDIDEKEAENQFTEILNKYEKYGKNPVTLDRYLKLHREIHSWM